MILKERIPENFYKLFRTRNADGYMEILVAVYEENNEVYAALGLTEEECLGLINEKLARSRLFWEEEPEEAGADGKNREGVQTKGISAVSILNRLTAWGWIKSDYDEKLNTSVITFPEYSQLYTELFQKLEQEECGSERESILSVYSALFTFYRDPERNTDILQSALQMARRLGQLLSNLQDGMRTYFEKLSERKNFIGIQEVLVEEINNSDSHKYAILTTTDSFYRYKEAVKEQIGQILCQNDQYRQKLEQEAWMEQEKKAERVRETDGDQGQTETSRADRQRARGLELCEETGRLVYGIEREFDLIERKYNKLIEQKTVFAKRALARVRYILQDGSREEDQLIRLVNLLDGSSRQEEILESVRERMQFTSQYRQLSEDSFYQRKERAPRAFTPKAAGELSVEGENQLTSFVPEPLYTRKELQEFRSKNLLDGKFVAEEGTVTNLEDLEKLLFLWQEETGQTVEEAGAAPKKITLGEEIRTRQGFRFSGMTIEEESHA